MSMRILKWLKRVVSHSGRSICCGVMFEEVHRDDSIARILQIESEFPTAEIKVVERASEYREYENDVFVDCYNMIVWK